MSDAHDADAAAGARTEASRDGAPGEDADRTLAVPGEPASASSASSSARSAEPSSSSAATPSSLSPHSDVAPTRASSSTPSGTHTRAPHAADAAPVRPAMHRPPSPAPDDTPHTPGPSSPPAATPPPAPEPPAASATDSSPAERIPPSLLRPFLCCRLCPQDTVVDNPITLRCGHTVCAAHVEDPDVAGSIPSNKAALTKGVAAHKYIRAFATCPVPGCTRGRDLPVDDSQPPAPLAQPTRVNITIRKLVDLFSRVDLELENSRRARTCHDADDDEPHSDHEDHEQNVSAAGGDSDDDLYLGPPSHPRPRTPPKADRPRKRRRVAPAPPRGAPTEDAIFAQFRKDLLSELTCEICFGMFYEPVTPPCQHTFCAKCLHRSMDHTDTCPLCREPLPAYTYFQEGCCNEAILKILLTAFPVEYRDNGQQVEADERHDRLDTPIFVAQLSFPGMPTMLHFFEPRYRLMLRRCLSMSQPHFGMVMPPRAGTQGQALAEYGTMLEIRDVRMLPDGRSIVETRGTHRFRIMERGTMDGYVIGRVERVDDIDDDAVGAQEELDVVEGATGGAPGLGGASTNAPSNQELLAVCHEFLEELKEGTPWVGQHLHNNYMPMPDDIAQFSFWMALLLPIDEYEKAKLLPIRSPRLRLRLVVHWIEQLRSNWHTAYASASRLQVVRWWLSALLARTLLWIFENLFFVDEGTFRLEPLPPLRGGRWPRVPRSLFLGPFAPAWRPPDAAELARLHRNVERRERRERFWQTAWKYSPFIGAAVAPVVVAVMWARYG